MKSRLGAIALAVSLLVPAALPGGPLAPREALAQDAATDIARQRYKEGVAAFDAGRFDEARLAFLQAYALKKHPAVLLNLGLSELKSGHPVEGGNHLTQFLREAKDASPEQRQTAQAGIEEAKRRAAFLVISVDQPGADVSVDGVLVGRSPLPDPVFVEPGTRTVVATVEGRNATAAVQAKRGAPTAVALATGGGAQPPPPPPPLPPPTSPAETPPPEAPAPGEPAAPPPSAPPEPGGESFFEWYGRKPLAWVGTGVTVVGLGFGIAFTALAGSASSSFEEAESLIKNKQAELGVEGSPCGPRDSDGSQDQVGFEAECSAARASLDDYDADVAIATVGWIAFGVGLAGTVTYVLVDHVAGGDDAPASGAAPRPIVAPVIAPGFQGAVVTGSF